MPANSRWDLIQGLKGEAPYTLSVKLSDFTVSSHTWRKNWVNCAVLTGNSAGLRTVLFSRLSNTELRSSLRESHSFLSLPANTTMTSSQGTSVSSNSFSRRPSHDIFIFKYHFLLHTLRFLFFFSDNIMTDVASKQQTTALFLSTIVTRKKDTQNWQKTDKPDGKPALCQRTFSSVFRPVFYTVKLHSLTWSLWGPLQFPPVIATGSYLHPHYPFHALPICWKSILILSSQLLLGLPSKALYTFPLSHNRTRL
jgi:hypothetical protein